MCQTITLRETPDFLLEEMVDDRTRCELDRVFWITNRGPHNFADFTDLTINKYNQGMKVVTIVDDLLDAETDTDFNRACLTFFNCSGAEASSLYPAPVEVDTQDDPGIRYDQRPVLRLSANMRRLGDRRRASAGAA